MLYVLTLKLWSCCSSRCSPSTFTSCYARCQRTTGTCCTSWSWCAWKSLWQPWISATKASQKLYPRLFHAHQLFDVQQVPMVLWWQAQQLVKVLELHYELWYRLCNILIFNQSFKYICVVVLWNCGPAVFLGAAQVLLQVVMFVVGEPQGPVAHHGVGAHEKALDSLGFLLPRRAR